MPVPSEDLHCPPFSLILPSYVLLIERLFQCGASVAADYCLNGSHHWKIHTFKLVCILYLGALILFPHVIGSVLLVLVALLFRVSSFVGYLFPVSCRDSSSPHHLPVSIQICNPWQCMKCQYGAVACALLSVIDSLFFFLTSLSSLGDESFEFFSIRSLAVMTLLIWACFFHFGRLRNAFSASFSL